MKSMFFLAAVAIATSSPVLAADMCTHAPKSKWQSQSALEAQLQAEGFKIRQVKVENGCYEVYATDHSGKRTNMAFNAETLKKVDNAEAGEN